jgi:D-xylose transport system substrate-binding protein
MIKGSPTDPNADFLRSGQQEVLPTHQEGDIKIVATSTEAGSEVAQKNMEQITTKNSNKVDAVVASKAAWRAAWWRRCRRAA